MGKKPSKEKPYPLSSEEERMLEEARKIFREAEKLPPPSPELQKRMQDQVGVSAANKKKKSK